MLVGAVLLLACVAFVIWLRHAAWQRIAQLEREFAAVRSEQFVLGLHARESVISMNAALLRFQLSGEAAEREAFERKGKDLTNRFERTVPQLKTPDERAAAAAFQEAFRRYRTSTAELTEPAERKRTIRKDTASQVHDVIEEKSREALRHADALAAAQAVASAAYNIDAATALSQLRRMLWLSVAALLAAIALLGLLGYTAFVRPLRVRLAKSEALLERQQKLAALGTLAAGVAHEIRNPLQAIKMRLYSLHKTLPSALREDEDLAVISGEINRLERIVKETLQFARPAEPDIVPVPVAELVRNVSQLLAGSLRPGVQLHVETEDGLLLMADRQQIQQVLINLVLNGAESIQDNGTVTIRAMPIPVNGRPDRYVRLEVSDTGRGITADIEGQMFNPFFSTKDGGAGLGLSVAARIIEKHGGTIDCSSQPGRGTTFSIVLPRHGEDEGKNPAH